MQRERRRRTLGRSCPRARGDPGARLLAAGPQAESRVGGAGVTLPLPPCPPWLSELSSRRYLCHSCPVSLRVWMALGQGSFRGRPRLGGELSDPPVDLGTELGWRIGVASAALRPPELAVLSASPPPQKVSAHLCLACPEGRPGEQTLAVGSKHRTPGHSGYCLGTPRPPGLSPENQSPQLCPHTIERLPGDWNQRWHVCSGALSLADPQGPWRLEWKLRPGEVSPFVGSGVRVEAGVWTPGQQVRALSHPGFQDEGSRPPC